MNDKLAKRIRALTTQASPPGEPKVAYTRPLATTRGYFVPHEDPTKPSRYVADKRPITLAPCWRNRYLRMKKLNTPRSK